MVGEAYALLTLTDTAVRRMQFEVRPWALELSNIEKHDIAKRFPVSVRVADWAVHGLVVDNSRGIVVAERDRLPGHRGLLGLNERSRRAGGWTRIESEPCLGIRVDFRMPVA